MVYTALSPVSAVQCNAILSHEKYYLCVLTSLLRSQYFSELKSRLSLAWRGEKSLEETWPSLVRALRRRLDTVRGAGSVPSLHFKHLNNNGGHLPAAALDKVGINIALLRCESISSNCLVLILTLLFLIFSAEKAWSDPDQGRVGRADRDRDGV